MRRSKIARVRHAGYDGAQGWIERRSISRLRSQRSMTATRCRWTLPYAAPPSERVSAIAPQSVLETAAGTGVVTRELACILPDNASITATDLNEPMIALAQSNLSSGRILWRQADARDLPFGDPEFDVVVCQFGVMSFPDKRRGFQETLRVLRPGAPFSPTSGTALRRQQKSSEDCSPYRRRYPRSRSGFSPPLPQSIDNRLGPRGGGICPCWSGNGIWTESWASSHEAAMIVCHSSRLCTHIDANDSTRLAEITNAVTDPGSGLGRSRGPLKH